MGAAVSSIASLLSSAMIFIPRRPRLLARPPRIRENAVPGGGDEVAHLAVLKAGKPGEHDRVPGIVVCHVIGFGIVAQECCTLFEIGADDQRPRFCRAMDGDARDQPLAELERGRTV